LLGLRDEIIELPAASRAADCVLAIPHHAGPGVSHIAQQRPEGRRVADENAVLYALAAHAALDRAGVSSRVVVAAHATDHDPNKDVRSPYCRALFGGPAPALLVECHGASRRAPHALEVSAGTNPGADPLRFGRRLAHAYEAGESAADELLAAQLSPGGRAARVFDGEGNAARESRLRFPALRTASLEAARERGIAALHLEATPRFRTLGVEGLALPADGARLGAALAKAIVATLA
jgi:hypothetical protein